jgi:hypothetical protein
MNQRSPSASTAEFFNKIGTKPASIDVRFTVGVGRKADMANL